MLEIEESKKTRGRSQFRVLMFVENAFPNDTRVKNEADALTQAGHSVVVIALQKNDQLATETVDGVEVYRLPRIELFQKVPRDKPTLLQLIWLKIRSLIGYLTEYVYFTLVCFIASIYVSFRHGFDVIHAHNPPDTLFLVALPWKLLGKKYVYDHHDLCPELYRSRFSAEHDVLSCVLQGIEWCNLKLADISLATNDSYRRIHIERGGRTADSVFVVRNGPNHQRMLIADPDPRLRAMGKSVLCYIGSLNPQDGVDYLLRALKNLLYSLKRDDFYCVIVGSGDSLNDLRGMARDFGLGQHVELTGYISDNELHACLAASDICVDPDPSSPLNDLSTWIKVMEYMAYAKPIVSFDLPETRFSAMDAGLFVPCNDELAFAVAIATLMDDRGRRESMGRFGRARVEKELQWAVVSKNLIEAYNALQRPL